MITQRQFLKLAGAAAVAPWGCISLETRSSGTLLNDVHSRLNPTSVHEVIVVRSVEDIRHAIARAKRERRALSIAGGRHAMGAQQFGTNTLHLDTRQLSRVLNFNGRSGLIYINAGQPFLNPGPCLYMSARPVRSL